MKKSSSAALLAGLVLLGLIPSIGCDREVPANVVNPPPGDVWKDPPPDPNKLVDTRDSWRKFVAEAKQLERMKLAEEKFISQTGPAATVKIVFMKDEIEYVQFDPKLNMKGVEPNRLYEVGVITLAAKENWGGNDYQIREYKIKFITPRRNGDWRYLEGTYNVSKFSGSRAADPNQLHYLQDKEYQDGYLRHLFVKPLAAKKPLNTSPQSSGGEQPVETKINP